MENSIRFFGWRNRGFSLCVLIAGLIASCDVPVEPPMPEEALSVSVTNLNFPENVADLSFRIENTGEGTLEWSISTDEYWLSVYPSYGRISNPGASQTVMAAVNRSGLYAGAYKGSIKINSNSGSATITVTMMVPQTPNSPAGLQVSRNSENNIRIDWYASPGATGYSIYRSTSSSGSYEKIGSTDHLYWFDTAVLQAKWYHYKVSAHSDYGEGEKSSAKAGYKKGWRFDNVRKYNPSNGIGFDYDLYAFGFKNMKRVLAIYAVYKNGSSYFYIPASAGSGEFGLVTKTIDRIPPDGEGYWNDARIYLYDSTWDQGWRNNTYEQYIKMRIYKSSSITSLNDPYCDQTNYYRIIWSSNGTNKPVINLVEELSKEESEVIDNLLMDAPFPGNFPNENGANPGYEHPGVFSNSKPD